MRQLLLLRAYYSKYHNHHLLHYYTCTRQQLPTSRRASTIRAATIHHVRTYTSSSASSSCTGSDSITDFTACSPSSRPKEVPGPAGIPSRAEQLRRLKASSGKEEEEDCYDVLIIGGGATGAGCALDAATRTFIGNKDDDSGAYQKKKKKLKVACIERGDFSSETSSRSTKLIWAGIKYFATATAGLLSTNLLFKPITTIKEFMSEIAMVRNCHKERRYMLEQNAHLCSWLPIAVPFTQWIVQPAPFGHPMFGLFPFLAPLVFKVYDSLSGFSCPPSYVMSAAQAKQKFPQLQSRDLKYCSVFYEAQHNDARTNIAIALTAAKFGAHICNYVEMVDVVTSAVNRSDSSQKLKVVGVQAKDRMTGEEFVIRAKKIIFAGGPFTDGLRKLEHQHQNNLSENESKKEFQSAVSGASGTHIILPGYYCPNDMGLLDYNTSDGRFLFYIPWLGSTLVGTTDKKCPPQTLPTPPEEEIKWLVQECSKYLTTDIRVRRSDVLSAWRGWRPLAHDPHAEDGAPVSRDHIISENPDTGVLFIAGGKWTTWREMAEDVIDRALTSMDNDDNEHYDNQHPAAAHPKSNNCYYTNYKCNTLTTPLLGSSSHSNDNDTANNNTNFNLPIQLIQQHGMSHEVATHLARTYGGRAHQVCQLSSATHRTWPRYGRLLVSHYPYIDAEVRYACREYACTLEDVLARRTRLAFLNQDAAKLAIPVIADIMAEELGWTDDVRHDQIRMAQDSMNAYGGRVPHDAGAVLLQKKYRNAFDVFQAMDVDGSGFIDSTELYEFSGSVLDGPVRMEEVRDVFGVMDVDGNGRICEKEFEAWWCNNDDGGDEDGLLKRLRSALVFVAEGNDDVGIDAGGAERGGSYMFG